MVGFLAVPSSVLVYSIILVEFGFFVPDDINRETP